ncbi:hypothetical protein WSK_3677 [Novosphingobium sp. Rr 2-17]|uniref:hypothetical protein n=1 Tax=Novosphingobium sp. Rr 2-17 TaxID=555793 RepID=UPI0002697BD3|nr:hypothetical protein [Novosphingobium sp. Rr 2-17]EIZ77668.1 hypothetical protein WSK_3677 [Novosphingobium sp. Rr 2-17]
MRMVASFTLSALAIASTSHAEETFPACHAPFSDLLSSKTFAVYPALGSARSIRPAKPDVRSGQAHLFRTVIRDEARRGPNFAGHFTIIRIGCGAGTVCVAIADALTGKVYFPKPVRSATYMLVDTGAYEIDRLNFQRDSNLLIVVGTVNERPQGYGMYYYRWNSGQLHLLRFVPASKLCGLPKSTQF